MKLNFKNTKFLKWFLLQYYDLEKQSLEWIINLTKMEQSNRLTIVQNRTKPFLLTRDDHIMFMIWKIMTIYYLQFSWTNDNKGD